MRGATCVYFEFVMYVRGGKGFARKVGAPIMELVLMRRDEPSLLSVEVVAYVKFRATSIAMFR